MSSAGCSILGTSVLALLLAGYLAQKFLPPPKPKIIGIDLGTTYSCVGVYEAGSGTVRVIRDGAGHSCIPSIVAFSGEDVVVGYKAAAQADTNPTSTLYDAKRFIGKHFSREELETEGARYPFKMVVDDYGMVHYKVDHQAAPAKITPEYIGSRIIDTLRQTAEANLSRTVVHAVMSVPAEFDQLQRNYTVKAAKLAGLEILRVISEPTAAALAYGLHQRQGATTVMVVDLGGGTLDVSLLHVHGGMFYTMGIAGNNHLGGQDFNQRLLQWVLSDIAGHYGRPLTHPSDMQGLRLELEQVKLRLTDQTSTALHLKLPSLAHKGAPPYTTTITRQQFEDLNMDLFKKVLEPIQLVLDSVERTAKDVGEVVLVGGSTRIPLIRTLIEEYFGKPPNVAIDPELAVTRGVAVQAGIVGGMWPLTVSAIEAPFTVKKLHVK